jgi:hypothetical protein
MHGQGLSGRRWGHFDGEATVTSADRHFPVHDLRTLSEAQRQLQLAGERGGVRQVITVVAKLSVVDSTTSEIRIVIATRPVKDLPLNGRNFTQLLALTPGVSPISVAQNSAGGSGWGGLA